MQEYETVFILDPGLDENQVNEEVQKTEALITSHGGKVLDGLRTQMADVCTRQGTQADACATWSRA